MSVELDFNELIILEMTYKEELSPRLWSHPTYKRNPDRNRFLHPIKGFRVYPVLSDTLYF